MDRDRSVVEFSVDKIRLTNDGKERHKVTFHVQNRCSTSKRVRVAVDKHSDPVSIDLRFIISSSGVSG